MNESCINHTNDACISHIDAPDDERRIRVAMTRVTLDAIILNAWSMYTNPDEVINSIMCSCPEVIAGAACRDDVRKHCARFTDVLATSNHIVNQSMRYPHDYTKTELDALCREQHEQLTSHFHVSFLDRDMLSFLHSNSTDKTSECPLLAAE